VSTGKDGVSVSVFQEKWDKAKEMIKATKEEIEANNDWLMRKD
jgi:hypothetical protein